MEYLRYDQIQSGMKVGVLIDGSVFEGEVEWKREIKKVKQAKVKFEWNGKEVFRRPPYCESRSRFVGAVSIVKFYENEK